MMPVPRCMLPLIVEAFHERPRGGDTPSLFMSCAISRGVRDIFIEDTPDDFGFSFDNDPPAFFAGDRSVAIGPSACIEALADTTSQTSAHLVGVVLAVELSHASAKPDQDRVHDTFVDGSYLY